MPPANAEHGADSSTSSLGLVDDSETSTGEIIIGVTTSPSLPMIGGIQWRRFSGDDRLASSVVYTTDSDETSDTMITCAAPSPTAVPLPKGDRGWGVSRLVSSSYCFTPPVPDTPMPLPPEVPSRGSLGHGLGTCKPCAWSWKPGGCSKGAMCEFCHTCTREDFKWKKHMWQVRRRATQIQNRHGSAADSATTNAPCWR
eukprot:NODE_16592_length_986_cov_7.020955.p1 GENE.NODE_16592_length_986_cov_7.020955~~NODE_16592_length_986_cov_7.020955.p1  ORF type:complete len:199 (-),score=10.14 NODE_16592_length_986_cov_7.020955:272-868(-)